MQAYCVPRGQRSLFGVNAKEKKRKNTKTLSRQKRGHNAHMRPFEGIVQKPLTQNHNVFKKSIKSFKSPSEIDQRGIRIFNGSPSGFTPSVMACLSVST